MKNNTFPHDLRAVIEQAGLTQRKAAEQLGIPLRTLENWLSGSRTPPEYVMRATLEELKKTVI